MRSHMFAVSICRCTATPGSNIPFSDSTTAVNLFDRLFTEEVWDLGDRDQKLRSHSSIWSHARNWFAVSVDEMRAFVWILILMCTCRMPRLHLYWQIMIPLIRTSGISDIMSRVRFQQIFRFLHLIDSAGQVPPGEDEHDKLYKRRGFMDYSSLPDSSLTTTLQQSMWPLTKPWSLSKVDLVSNNAQKIGPPSGESRFLPGCLGWEQDSSCLQTTIIPAYDCIWPCTIKDITAVEQSERGI